MAMNRVVVRYHEVALKKTNRTSFVALLTDNILKTLAGTGVNHAHRAPGRIILHLTASEAWPEVRKRLRNVFGVANFLLCERVHDSIPALGARIAEIAASRTFTSFAVRTKRCDKTFAIKSPQVSALVGAAIQSRTGAAVDLQNPDFEVHIEILPREMLYSFEKVDGARGLPGASGGTVLTLLSGGIDSPVAAFRMLGRGCRVELVHFHGAPYQSRESLDKAVELTRALQSWQLDSRLHAVAFGPIQKEIVARAPRRARVVLYRRMMMRIAGRLATDLGASALVTGDSLGQVASQTLPNLTTVEDASALPILRPLIGMDKEEIIGQARRIGTYEISIQPDQDCCQLFVPKHPSTQMTVGAAVAAESDLDIAALVDRACDSVESIDTRPILPASLLSSDGLPSVRT